MTRLMLDSTEAADIPDSYEGRPTELVAGYVDGFYAWSAADWARHAGRGQVRICIGTDRLDAQVIDIEPGNHDAAAVVPWIEAKWHRGETPTVYCFSDAGPAGYRIGDVRAACDRASVPWPLFWITDWRRSFSDFDPAGDPTIVALQYAGSAKTGGHFDANAVAEHWPGVDPEKESQPMTPQRIAQTADLSLAQGEVGMITGTWQYANGPRSVTRKVVGYSAGRRIYRMYPPVDPDADPTEDVSAEPAIFIVDTATAA